MLLMVLVMLLCSCGCLDGGPMDANVQLLVDMKGAKQHYHRSSDRIVQANKEEQNRPPSNYNYTLYMVLPDGKLQWIRNMAHVYDLKMDRSNYWPASFFLPRFLKASFYLLYCVRVFARPEIDGKAKFESKFYYYIAPTNPVALITGGEHHVAPLGTELTLRANESLDIDHELEKVNDPDPGPLQYSWTIKGSPRDPLSTTDTVTLPSDLEDSTVIQLTVFASNGGFATRATTVERSDNAQLTIRCRFNCPPHAKTTKIEARTLFEVRCEGNCHGVLEEHYQWSIAEETPTSWGLDLSRPDVTFFGPVGRKLGLHPDCFWPDRNYVVGVALKGNKGRAKMTFVAAPQWANRKCGVDPKLGQSITTVFVFKCFWVENLTKIEFYVNGEFLAGSFLDDMNPDFIPMPYLLEWKPPERDLRVHLPANSRNVTAILMAQVDKVATSVTFDVEVTSSLSPKSLKDKLRVFRKLSEDLSLDSLKVLVDELSVTPLHQGIKMFVDDLKSRVLRNMSQMTFVDRNDVLMGAQVFNKLTRIGGDDHLDLSILRHQQQVCNRLSLDNWRIISRMDYATDYLFKSEMIANALFECAELITTITNISSDGEQYYKDLDHLRNITSNLINTTSLLSKTMALVSPVGGPLVNFTGPISATFITKDEGRYLVESTIRVEGLELRAPWDFAESSHDFDILITVFRYDLTWWNPQKIQMSTQVSSIEFWHSRCRERIVHFQSPVEIFLDVTESARHFEPGLLTGDLTVGADISVHRISLPMNYGLRIQFYNLSDIDEFDVLVTKFKYPTKEDFVSVTSVSVNGTDFVAFTNYEDYGIWCYVAIVPRNPLTVSFRANLTASTCAKWDVDHWEPSCKVGLRGTSTRIHCECNDFSVIAGYLEPISALPQFVLDIPIELKLEPNWVVFITTAITWGLCFVLMLCGARRALGLTEKAFYLADNVKTDLYCYLLAVKTGDRCGSGTTSKITIIVHGKRRQSTAHVLNYPDPERRLLQTGMLNVFILTTTKYLGEVRQVELWFDSSGLSPSWYCDDVTVFDMQSRREWFFRIETMFDVLSGGETYFATRPSIKVLRHDKVRLCNRHNTWFLSNKEENFGVVARVIVVLSKVLCTYVCLLFFVGLPTFHRFDCLDAVDFDYREFTFFSSLITSLAVFVFHVPIIVIFRHSQVQYGVNVNDPPLSWRCRRACWIVVITVIMICVTLLIVYGFWVPLTTSLLWLTCCMISLAIDVVILDNVLNAICKFHLKVKRFDFNKRYISIRSAIESQRSYLHTRFGTSILRPFLQNYYVPLRGEDIKARVLYYHLRRQIANELIDLLIFLLFIICLYAIVNIERSILSFHNKREIETMLEGIHTDSLAFSDIDTVNGLFEYLNNTLMEVMHPTFWYDQYKVEGLHFMKDYSNKYLGTVRLRQHRAKFNISESSFSRRLNLTCTPEFSRGGTDKSSFGYQWTEYSTYLNFDPLGEMWNYTTSDKSGTFPMMGDHGFYPGGGYVTFLGESLQDAHVNLRNILRRQWIDFRTRCVIVEFLVYNANVNLFNGVTLMYEQSASGYVSSTIHVQVADLLFIKQDFLLVTKFLFCFFVLLVLVLSLRKLAHILGSPLSFFKDSWFWVDLVIISLSVSSMAIEFIHMSWASSYFNKASPTRFLNYFSILYIDELQNIFTAVLICVVTIRLCSFLQFAQTFAVLKQTFSYAWINLVFVAFASFVLLTSFALSAIMLFGNSHMEFNDLSVYRILCTLILRMNVSRILQDLTYLSHIYICLYLIFMKMCINIFITTVLIARRAAKYNLSARKPEIYTTWDYVREIASSLPLSCFLQCKRSLGGAGHFFVKVTAKSHNIRYAGGITLDRNRVEIMKCATIALLGKLSKSKNYSQPLARSLKWINVEKPAPEIFFKGHNMATGRLEVVNNGRLVKIEDTVNRLLVLKRFDKTSYLNEQLEQMRQMNLALSPLLEVLNSCNIDEL